jgi:hypothetical protein
VNINIEVMGAVELRNTMINYINEADDRLLSVLKAVVESYRENDVVAYTVTGEPLTKKQYNEGLLMAEKEIVNGDFISQEDLEKDSQNW